MPQGTVRWFDAERGFGFLALGDDAEDLFVHVSEVVGQDGPATLREGQSVEFEVGEGDRGPQARQVRVTGDAAVDAALGVLGTVSWYEPAKGYGFLTPDTGDGEIFVHSSAIVGGGVIAEGQRVAFLVVEGEKGPQADHLLPLGAHAAAGPGRAAVTDDGADGTVTWYDAGKGFGFITPDSGEQDVFVHARSLHGDLTELVEGDRVSYRASEGEKGLQAQGVRLVGGPSRGGRGGRGGSDRRDPGRGPAPSRGSQRGGQGVVARYDAERGFGFITPDDGGPDLFVHVSVVRDGEELYEGDRVRYQVRQSDRGPQADRVDLL
ncbi:cold-shock protein [Cellulomonas sp. C5510]|uniref:cold-shock protein n=1 Tax=Cellulomonas sp. C5510 TaxID=2871170 RepID=UPI001C97137F|nr:cold shock domain-containing protein [Cellulomonas sp. C5510]QZN85533.1 cold shock domain-containing protein [Cellulomonas sp. C5510]